MTEGSLHHMVSTLLQSGCRPVLAGDLCGIQLQHAWECNLPEVQDPASGEQLGRGDIVERCEDSLHHTAGLCSRVTAVGLHWRVLFVAYSCSVLGSAVCQERRFWHQVSNEGSETKLRGLRAHCTTWQASAPEQRMSVCAGG